jgi:hypothetical protein
VEQDEPVEALPEHFNYPTLAAAYKIARGALQNTSAFGDVTDVARFPAGSTRSRMTQLQYSRDL